MCDRSGVIRDTRENLDAIKAEFATSRSLSNIG